MLNFVNEAVKAKKEICFHLENRGLVRVRTANDAVLFVPHEKGLEFRVEKNADKKPSGDVLEVAPITVALHEVDSIYIPLDSCVVSAE